MRIEVVAEKMTDILIRQGLIESDQTEICVYGMTLMISSFFYFVDDICQHQSTAWFNFDFR